MKKLILTLFAAMLACSPILADNATVKTDPTQSQIGKAKNKKNHKKKKGKKKAEKTAHQKKASPKAEAA